MTRAPIPAPVAGAPGRGPAPERTVYVGVDGGGTRARVVVMSAAGVELVRRTGPPGLVRAERPADAAATIASLVREVLDASGATAADAVLCCGLAGAGRPAEQEAVRDALSRADVARVVHVVGDAEALMEDAFGAGPGVLLIAGTGSIARGRAADGTVCRIGGWGMHLGDEGSGYAMGAAALRAVARAEDGREPPTALRAAVLEACGVADAGALIGWAGRATKADIAAFAPAVLAAAAAGDHAAARIRADALAELCLLASVAARSAALLPPHFALAGGVAEALREPLTGLIRRDWPDASFNTGAVDGARGAAALARRRFAG